MANHGGRPNRDYTHADCFFDWLGAASPRTVQTFARVFEHSILAQVFIVSSPIAAFVEDGTIKVPTERCIVEDGTIKVPTDGCMGQITVHSSSP